MRSGKILFIALMAFLPLPALSATEACQKLFVTMSLSEKVDYIRNCQTQVKKVYPAERVMLENCELRNSEHGRSYCNQTNSVVLNTMRYSYSR